MAWSSGEIGKVYDFGIAVRPNPDGSTTALTVKNAKGDNVQVSSIAYMSDASYEQEESVDLIRKAQLTRLSTANVIDREFTLNPQATQGNWSGGELQRIFTDPTAYYQGRGLIWPTSSFVPVQPTTSKDVNALVDNLGAAFTSVVEVGQQRNGMASGFLTNAGVGVAHAFRGVSANGTNRYIVFTLVGSSSLASGNLISPPIAGSAITHMAIVNGNLFFVKAGDLNIYQMTYTSGQALNAPVVFAVAANQVNGLMGSYIGKDWVLAASADFGQPTRLFVSGAGAFADIPTPSGIIIQTMAFVGGVLYLGGSDGVIGVLMTYDVAAQQTTTVVQLIGITGLRCGSTQGALFLLAYSVVGRVTGNQYLNIDMYLVSGSLQFIGRLNPLVAGLPPSLSYTMPLSVSNVAGYGQYAFFAVSLTLAGAPQAVVYAYDVVRGTFFTAIDQFPLTQHGGLDQPMGIGVVPGADSVGDFTVFVYEFDPTYNQAVPAQTMRACSFGSSLAGVPVLAGGGRVIGSVLDFTSASVKLYRQIVATHEPIPVGGQFFLAAYLDRDGDNLTADTAYKTTNITVGSTVTILPINALAKKLVYLADWSTVPSVISPHPISIAIQAATGWVWTTQLAMHDKVQTYAGRSGADTVWSKQNVDVTTAINFLRAIWRQRGGLFIATLPNGDTYNAVLQKLQLHGKQLVKPSQAGHPALYEGTYELVFAEDL